MIVVFRYMFVFFVGYLFSLILDPCEGGVVFWLKSTDPGFIFAGISAMVSIIIASYTHYKAKEREAESRVFSEKSKVYSEFMDLIFEMMKSAKGGTDAKELSPEQLDRFLSVKKRIYIWGNKNVLKYMTELSNAEINGKNVLDVSDKLMSELRADLGHKDRFSFIKYIVIPDKK
ncbi:hypothetical protein [Thalassospira alkalitolerans]|uniref:hypothetical protein n=1 Tax=Thalassospira alkalitolerans TaxID=1293890 RepID=UPI003AA9AB91